MSDDETHAAYDEAGHAVAAAALGVRVPQATIERDPNWVGHFEYDPQGIDFNDPARIRDLVVIGLSGPAAAERAGARDADERLWWDRGDGWACLALGRRITRSPEDWEALFDECQARAHALVREHWEQVQAVATALLKLRTLSSSELNSLLEGPRDRVEG